MAYEMVMPYHLHMPSYFLETFTEYPYCIYNKKAVLTFQDCFFVIIVIQFPQSKSTVLI